MPADYPDEANVHEVAAILTMISFMCPCGPRNVDAHQVRIWHDRRARNGFPAALGEQAARGPRRPRMVWDLMAVANWMATWKPDKGGAPRGNTNGQTAGGRYAGLRAQRELRRLNGLTER